MNARYLLRVCVVIGLILVCGVPVLAGNCLQCGASGDYADGTGIPTTLTNLTVEAWVYHNNITNRIERYVTLGSEVAVIRHDGASSPGQLHFYIKTSGSLRSLRVNSALTNGVWTHVAGTWDGTTMRLYKDGSELTNSVPGGTLNAPDGTVKLSRDSNEWLNGRIDEARVWDKARTGAEIQRGMHVGLAGSELGLAAYWRLDESSGTNAQDSADGVALTLHGNAHFAVSDAPVAYNGSGGGGNTLLFSLVNGYVNIGHGASLDVGNTLTVEAWVKPYALDGRFGVFSTRLDNSAGSFQLEIGNGNGGTGRVAVSAPGTWVAETGNNVIVLNQWHHIAYVRTGPGVGNQAIYINGVAQTLITDADYTFTNNVSDKVIGSGTSGGNLFSGAIDDLRVWNTARTADQIRDDMHLSLPGDTSGLAAGYTFDRAGGATLPDLSTNANHGTLVSIDEQYWVAGTFPCANAIAARGNVRGVWSSQTNSLASARLSATNAAAADPDFALFGHDGGADAWQTADIPAGLAARLGRVWRVEAAGSVNGQIVVDTTGLDNVGDGTALRLLVDADGAFTNATVVAGTFSAPRFTVSGQALSDGRFFTLGALPSFAQNTGVSLPRTLYGSVAWGDYDNDGRLDLLITGNSGGTFITRIYHNDGGGAFTRDTTADAGLPGLVNSCGVWGDYNNDGRLDFVVSGSTGSEYITRIYRNNGDGTFTWDVNASAGLSAGLKARAAWGDYNNDGHLDLALLGNENPCRIYRNNGDGTFAEDVQAGAGLPAGGEDGSVAWGDYDNDGHLDLLFTGDGARIYRNDPAPNGLPGRVFTEVAAELDGINRSRAAWGDYDNDGRLDWVVQGYRSGTPNFSGFYRNDGGGGFSLDATASAGVIAARDGSLGWGDYDNDGRLDLLQVRSVVPPGYFHIYRNCPDGTFTNTVTSASFGQEGAGAWGDYDNDGRLDVVASGNTTGVLYRNTGPLANTLPVAPANLQSAVTNGAVTLSWDAASDAETPTNSLTYNLRIGTAPGASDVFSAMANPTTGFRRLPAMGNVGGNRSWTLPSLPQGQTYHWSVQAVDGAWAGGAWATEGSFAVPNLPVVTTAPTINSSGTTATGGGEAVSAGDSPVTARGVCWNTAGAPTLADNYTTDGSGTGSFASALTGLVSGQVYYVRAYATSASGTTYGPQRTFMAGAVPTEEPPGYALSFNGSNQYVSVESSDDLELTDRFTLEVWVKAARTNGLQGLFAKSQADGDGGWYLRLNGSEVEFDGLTTTGLGLETNAWYHLAAVKDGGARALYVNGAAVALSGTTNTLTVNTYPVRIGRDSSTNCFAGALDEARIWNLARSQQQVREAMHLTFDAPLPGLVVYYDFDQSSGTNMPDRAQRALWMDNTLVGMTGNEWIRSTIPAGRGAAASRTEAAGQIVFTNIGLTADFTTAGAADLTATRIDEGPGRPRLTQNRETLAPWWVVDRFGSGGFAADLTFVVRAGLSAADESDPSRVALFHRPATSDGAWTQVAVAAAVNAAGQSATFTNISAFGQFTIGYEVWTEATGAGLPPAAYAATAWGDYNNDGLLDVIIAGNFTNNLYLEPDCETRIYRNNGDGTFTRDTAADTGLPGFTGGGVAWGDYDNDGWLDFGIAGIRAGTDTGYFRVYHNNGDGTFTWNTNANLIQTKGAKAFLGGIAWGDYNNDGRLDLVVLGASSVLNGDDGPRIYRNEGNGVFNEDTVASSNLVQIYRLQRGQPAWGDYNNDGRLDLLLVGSDGRSPGYDPFYRYARIYRNNSDGTFTRDTDADDGLPEWYYSHAAWGDYDNDGWLDFALIGYEDFVGSRVRIYRNNGNGTFTQNTAAGLLGVNGGSVAWGDYNNDGRLDLLVTGNRNSLSGDLNPSTRVYRNDGDGVFTDIGAGFAGWYGGQAAFADCDGNGTLDILVMGNNSNEVPETHLFLNHAPIKNTPPAAPAGLAAAVSNDTVTLSWNAAGDAQTPSAGLTHNLRIGTTPGGSDVFTGMADTNGWRRLPALGNANMNRAWTMSLAPGQYYWSVQAVDGAFAGGSWADGGSFRAWNAFLLTATAGANGAITPSGNIWIVPGASTNFLITPSTYWHIASVTTNAIPVGAVSDFTWSNVTADGTIHAYFDADLAAKGTPHWWLAQFGWTSNFDTWETADTDGDGRTAGAEYVADTNPTNPASYFCITAISNVPPWTVYFNSSANRNYTLTCCTNLTGNVWTNVPNAGPRPGIGGPDSFAHTNAVPSTFYRIRVQLP